MKSISVIVQLHVDEDDKEGELDKIVQSWITDPSDVALLDDSVEIGIDGIELLQPALDRATMAEKERIRRLAIFAGANDFAKQLRDEDL